VRPLSLILFNISPLGPRITTEVSKANVMRFQTPSAWRSRWRWVNSFVPYLFTKSGRLQPC
jgi:hypothetical protein